MSLHNSKRIIYWMILLGQAIIERKENALASGADEGRDKLRKAWGSCT